MQRAVFVFLLVFFKPTEQVDCSLAPDIGQKIMCLQLVEWDKEVRKHYDRGGEAEFLTQTVDLPPVYDCMTISCICGYLGSSCPGKSVRKEYRMMTDDERSRFNAALWTIQRNGDYLDLGKIHENSKLSPGAHSGPAFFPWHREFIKRMEIAIRRADPLVPGLPYWDSVLDKGLPNSADSVFWGDELMGRNSADGTVRNGAFAGWTFTVNGTTKVFTRELGDMSTLMTPQDLDNINSFTTIGQFLGFTAGLDNCTQQAPWNAPEYIHGKPHVWTGGEMYLTKTSTHDPLFFLHHSFIDLIWENWRILRQTRTTREMQYPQDNPACSTSAHFAQSQMVPFAKVNMDGLSNQYFDNLVSYAPPPTCTSSSRTCGSKYLFCDISHGSAHCVSKAVIGGSCAGFFNGEDVCYGGQCVNGVCSASSTGVQLPTTTTTTTTAAPSENCFNDHYCCAWWANIGQCQVNPDYMQTSCQASCGVCSPKYSLTIACSDRSDTCPTLSRVLGCSTDWMAENCRQYCGLCTSTRAQQCGANGFTWAVRSLHPSKHGKSNQPSSSLLEQVPCINNHFCCAGWEILGYCKAREHSEFMKTHCAPSCGLCEEKTPHHLWNNSKSCVDFLPDCPQRAAHGHCQSHKNYMKENCKNTCERCDVLDLKTRMTQCGLDSGINFSRLMPEQVVAM